MFTLFKKQSGQTAVELVITIAIIAIISGAVYGFVRILLKAQARSFGEIIAGNEAKRAIFSMADNFRDAIQSATGGYPIENAANQAITFYSNIDQDANIERVRYFLSGTDLQMGTIEPQGTPLTYPEGQEQVRTIARYIRNNANPIFYYYDKNYTGTEAAIDPNNVGEIRIIKIMLSIDTKPTENPPATNIETEVQLRNLKDNL